MEKILITGTGRCGTTFLIKLFSFLEFNTGFNRKNYNKFIFNNCNSGMEKTPHEPFYIIKNPNIVLFIEKIIKNTNFTIKKVIIPIRDYKLSAESRVKHGKNAGGLLNATDKQSQINYYRKVMANYLYFMTKYEIPTIFIDFDKMTTDKKYLFDKLECILQEKNITFELFSKIYDEVSEISKPGYSPK